VRLIRASVVVFHLALSTSSELETFSVSIDMFTLGDLTLHSSSAVYNWNLLSKCETRKTSSHYES
jgi:hypothetical protein